MVSYNKAYGGCHNIILLHLLPLVPSSPAQNVSVVSTTATTLLLRWEPPQDYQQNGIIVQYTVRVVSVDGEVSVTLDSASIDISVTTLRPYTTYNCSIAAETSIGRGPFSSVITAQTDEAGIW